MNVRCWDKSTIDPLFDAFCHLTTFVRALEGLPNATRNKATIRKRKRGGTT